MISDVASTQATGSTVDEPLYGFYENGKVGFFNRKLHVVIPAIYSRGNPWAPTDIGGFSDGLAMVSRSLFVGWVDKSGKELELEDQSYSAARHFSEGLAVVDGTRNRRRVAGFVDTLGKIIIEPREEFASVGYWEQCTSVTHFSCGRALVAQHQDEGAGSRYLGYIDREGKWAIQGDFEWAGNFSEGLAGVRENGRVGCIDTFGHWVIEPQFGYVSRFVDGLAPFRMADEKKWGVIDKTGKIVVKPEFDYMLPFMSGVAIVQMHPQSGPFRQLYGAIDKSGNLVVPLAFQDMTWFHEGLAGAVEVGVDKWSGTAWGVIDTSGNYIVPPGIGYPFGFQDGLCRVRISPTNDKDTCYIDRAGQVVWKSLSPTQRRVK